MLSVIVEEVMDMLLFYISTVVKSAAPKAYNLDMGYLMKINSHIFGFIEHIVVDGQTATVTGWARNPESSLPANKIYIRNRLGLVIAEVIPSIERPDVAEIYECSTLLMSGWTATVSASQIDSQGMVTAFVIIDGEEHALSGTPSFRKAYPKMFAGFDLNTLIQRGLKVGSNFSMQPDCFIDYSHCWLISIGDNVIFAPRVQIIAHDTSLYIPTMSVKIGLITIGDNVFLGNGVIVLLGVSIGDNCIVGAGSVVTKDIPAGYVAAGNPARVICKTSELVEKNSAIGNSSVFDNSFTIENGIDNEMKKTMIETLKSSGGIGYIKRKLAG